MLMSSTYARACSEQERGEPEVPVFWVLRWAALWPLASPGFGRLLSHSEMTFLRPVKEYTSTPCQLGHWHSPCPQGHAPISWSRDRDWKSEAAAPATAPDSAAFACCSSGELGPPSGQGTASEPLSSSDWFLWLGCGEPRLSWDTVTRRSYPVAPNTGEPWLEDRSSFLAGIPREAQVSSGSGRVLCFKWPGGEDIFELQ